MYNLPKAQCQKAAAGYERSKLKAIIFSGAPSKRVASKACVKFQQARVLWYNNGKADSTESHIAW